MSATRDTREAVETELRLDPQVNDSSITVPDTMEAAARRQSGHRGEHGDPDGSRPARSRTRRGSSRRWTAKGAGAVIGEVEVTR